MATRILTLVEVLSLFCGAGLAEAQSCCNCNPYDTDIECAMACNAMTQRCRPEIPRPLSSSNLVGYCCAVWMAEGAFRSAREALPNPLPRRTPCVVRGHLDLYGKATSGETCR